MYYFYLLRCKDGSLYAGSTRNLKRREQAHNAGTGSIYVRSRGGGVIIYSERFQSWSKTLKREAEVKRISKAAKEALVLKKTEKQFPPPLSSQEPQLPTP